MAISPPPPHPEVLAEVNEVFRKLYRRNPNMDGTRLWQLAQEIRWELDMVETCRFRLEHYV